MIESLDPQKLHHAYCVEGECEQIVPDLCAFFEREFSFPVKANPDFWFEEHAGFGIDEARKLKEAASRRSISGRRVFVVAFSSITTEAQNALLKLLEEPGAGTHFFLVVPSRAVFLETLLSRVVVIPRTKAEAAGAASAEDFLKADFPERMELLGNIIEEKDKARAAAFLNGLESVLYRALPPAGMDRTAVSLFEEIRTMRGYLYGRSASVKMILEYIALVTPTY